MSVARRGVFLPASLAVCFALGAVFSACIPPPPPGAMVPAPPDKFDRSWSAALGALADEGVQVARQDRPAGLIQGSRGGIEVTARVSQLAGGSVQVEFGVSGNLAADPGLKDRIVGSYSRRMGR